MVDVIAIWLFTLVVWLFIYVQCAPFSYMIYIILLIHIYREWFSSLYITLFQANISSCYPITSRYPPIALHYSSNFNLSLIFSIPTKRFLATRNLTRLKVFVTLGFDFVFAAETKCVYIKALADHFRLSLTRLTNNNIRDIVYCNLYSHWLKTLY